METLTFIWRQLHYVHWGELVRDVQQHLTPIDTQQPVNDIQIVELNLAPLQQRDIDRVKLCGRRPIEINGLRI